MHTCIAGPGALGSLLAATLWPVREDNRLLLLDHRPERAAMLNDQGIRLKKDGRETSAPVPVTADPAAIQSCDVLLLCVKAGDVNAALERMRPFLAAKALVIGMENGISHLRPLQQFPGPTAAGVTTMGATLVRPGLVLYGGSGHTSIGLLNHNNGGASRLGQLAAWLTRSGMSTEVVADILPHVWGKLFINVGINALTGITNRTNGRLLTSCSIRSTMKQAVAEAMAVARARQVTILGDPVKTMFTVCRRTRNNVSSMLQDIRARKHTEIDALNGAIVREGNRCSVPTPVNADLVRKIKAIETSWVGKQ